MIINIQELKKREALGLIRSSICEDMTIWMYTDKCVFSDSWDYFTRSARGLVTDSKTGRVLAKPFDKFFNLYENEETSYKKLPMHLEYEIHPKIDGSLLNIFYHNGWRAVTKGSFDNEYIDYAYELIDFEKLNTEWKHLKNLTICTEIVLPPERDSMKRAVEHEPGLYFLAAIDKRNGVEYLDARTQFRDEFISHGIRIPEVETRGLDWVLEHGSREIGVEGWVIRWVNGFRVKVKTFHYLGLFKWLKYLNEKSIREFVANNEDDLWIEHVPGEFRDDIKALVGQIKTSYSREFERLNEIVDEGRRVWVDRKTFALSIKDEPRKHLCFMLLDGKDIRAKLIEELD